jgi:hypothetical protein
MPRYSNEPRQYSIPELSESYLAGMYNYAPPRTIGPKRKIGAANYGKSPLSSNPNTSRSLGLQNVSRTIDSVDKTYKEVKGVTAGLKSFLNNFGETGQGYSNWLTSVGLGRSSGRRYGSFARNTDAVANLVDAGVGLTNLLTARGKSRKPKLAFNPFDFIGPLFGSGKASDRSAIHKDLVKLVKKHIKRRGGALDMSQYSGNTRSIANNSLYADWATRAVERPLPNVTYIDMAPNMRGESGELL